MQVEDIPGIRLPARRAAQQRGYLSVRPSLFGQVVVDDQRVFAAVAEVLAHCAAGIGRDELHRRRRRRARRHDDGMVHGSVFRERAHDVRDRRHLLADRDIDTLDVGVLLVDHRVHRDGGFADLPVADNQFPLPAADGHHGVDALDPHLHRLGDGMARDDARGNALDRQRGLRFHRTFAIDGIAEGVHHAAKQFRAHRHFENPLRAARRHAFR